MSITDGPQKDADMDRRTYDDDVRDDRERDGDRILDEGLGGRRVRVEFGGIGENVARRA